MRIDNPSISGSLSFIGGNNSISATSVNLTGSFSGSVVGTFEGAFSSTATANISGAFDSVSSSLASRVASQESFSSSLDNTFATDSDLNLVSSSVDSLNAATSSYALKTEISGSFTSLSASLSTRLTNDESSVTSLNAATSSYLQNTTDTLTGDLTVTGTITAQDLHVQEVTSSIVYSSGSNIFGTDSSNTQILYGNVGIGTAYPSSSLHIYDSSASRLTVGQYGAPHYNQSGMAYQVIRATGTGTERALLELHSGNQGTKANVQAVGANNTVYFGSLTNSNASYGNDVEAFYFNTAGNVGLGTSNPTAKLHVSGSVKIESGLLYMDASQAINFAAAAQIYYNSTSGGIQFTGTSGGNTLFVKNNGDVGINGSPVSFSNYRYLTINGNSTTEGGVVYLRTSDASHTAEMYVNSNGFYISGNNAGQKMFLNTAGSTKVTIDAGGNVGIGTTSPRALLDLGGTTNSGLYSNDVLVVSSSNSVILGNDIRDGWTLNASTPTSTTFQSKLNIWTGNEDHLTFGGSHTSVVSAWEDFNLWINNDEATYGRLRVYGGSQKAEFLRFSNTLDSFFNGGKLGIGVTSPARKFHVTAPDSDIAAFESDSHGLVFQDDGSRFEIVGYKQTGGTYNDIHLRADVNNTLVLKATTGNVGIGTASPNNKLSVLGNANFGSTLYSYAGPAQYGAFTFPRGEILFSNTNSQNQLYLATNAYNNSGGVFAYRNSSQTAISLGMDNGAFNFLTAGSGTADAAISWSTRMIIQNDGNVGIGTTSPGATLSLGNAGGQRFYVYEGGSTRSGLGVDLSGSSRELSIFHTTSDGSNGNISFGNRLDSNGVYTEKMRLTGDGKLGIGTDPGHMLHAYGTSAWTAKIQGSSELGAFIGHADGYGMAIRTTQTSSSYYLIALISGGTNADSGGSEVFSVKASGDTYLTGDLGIGALSSGMSLDASTRTDGINLPKGTTAQRPTPTSGTMRFNTTLSGLEFYDGSVWNVLKPDLNVGTASSPATTASQIYSATNGTAVDGVYYYTNGGQTYQAYTKFAWIENEHWVLTLKVHNRGDMTSGNALWGNTTLSNESDFNLTSGTMSKYASYVYHPFTRILMDMNGTYPAVMIWNSTQTSIQSVINANPGGNLSGYACDSTNPAIGNSRRYDNAGFYIQGGPFSAQTGQEPIVQEYGISCFANSASNSTTDNTGLSALGYAGAYIGCPLDEGGHTFNNTSNVGSDSGFGFGGGAGNAARTWSAGYGEWNSSAVVNTLPGYIWIR